MSFTTLHQISNVILFVLVMISGFQTHNPFVVVGVVIAYFVIIGTIAFKTYIPTIVETPDTDEYSDVSKGYIMENVEYSFVEGMLRLKLSSDSEYPVVLGFKGENSIGNLENTKRELQPGESVCIDKDTGEQKELLKEDIFHVTYEDDSEETVNTSVDEDFDALLFCKSFRYQEDSLLQKFNVEETSGDIV